MWAIIFLTARVGPAPEYRITLAANDISQAAGVVRTTVTIWGIPQAASHTPERVCGGTLVRGCPSGVPEKPMLTLPTSCLGPQTTILRTDSWENPGEFLTYSFLSHDNEVPPNPIGATGCELLDFSPSMAVKPTSNRADSPSGLHADLSLPQNDDPEGLAEAHLKRAVVTLPEGVAVNPSAADGLEGCAPAEIDLATSDPPTCPDGSKVGTVKINSPLLDHPVPGTVYLATQGSNPFNSLIALYLVADDPETGVVIKIPGRVETDPQTGRLQASFDNNPQMPFSSLSLDFKDGARSTLTTPATCGKYTIHAELSPWSAVDPDNPTPAETVDSDSTFTVDRSPDGGPCVAGHPSRPGSSGDRSDLPFSPSFAAGTVSPAGGGTSPFRLVVARQDGTKFLKSIKSVQLPEGLLGRVGSVPVCSEPQADLGTCPEASRVGRVQAALGSGSSPLWVPQAGKQPTAVYLSGPYRGAPYSLSIVVPAQAGPFDLGKVVVRSALHVDERTAQISSGIDETRLIDTDGTVTEVLPEALPRILKGILLNQREIRLIMDREDFMVNPTDCSQQRVAAEIHSYGDDRVEVGNRFRAVDCASLGFAPRFAARILNKGRKSTLRSFHPRTRFTVVPRKGDANIGGARVVLPSSTILDQANIGTTCTRAQMAERNCPERSIVGYAKAWSPLLRKAVEGPVFLAANGGVRPLPDLAAVLDGEIRVVLQGEVSTLRRGGKARLQNTFRVVPDAPVSRFVLTMRGGAKRGLLVNSTDLCRSRERGAAVFVGQNGKRHRLRPRIATAFRGCGKARRRAARKVARRKAMARKAARS